LARTINPRAHAAKRDDILAAARRLIYTAGFEQMTIQDVLEELHISKGAFYHYFASKSALLEGLVGRMLDEALGLLSPIVEDARLSALDKLRRYFAALFAWRAERKDLLLAILRVWYQDDNALAREKVRAAMVERFTPLLTAIIRQGIEEGIFTTPYPEQVANVLIILRMGLSETLAHLLLSHEERRDDRSRFEPTIAVYTDVIERALGLPAGSLQLADAGALASWLV
jgi:AcrR family transcriptional regulator